MPDNNSVDYKIKDFIYTELDHQKSEFCWQLNKPILKLISKSSINSFENIYKLIDSYFKEKYDQQNKQYIIIDSEKQDNILISFIQDTTRSKGVIRSQSDSCLNYII